jgi:hypothetical protein
MKKIFPIAIVALVSMVAFAPQANAATVNSNIGVAGTFDAQLGGSGTASLTSASGTFRQWLFFGHTNINVTASAQTVGLSIPTVNPPTMAASGTVNMDYDDITPGTPQVVNSVNADLNGGLNIGYGINVDPIAINTSLGGFNLNLNVTGNITDIDFVSTGPGAVIGGNGGTFATPGDFFVTLDGNVTAQLTGVPLIGSVNLGTITTIAPTTLSFSALLPGTATTTDLDGGVGPFPNDMLAAFQASLGATNIGVPLSLPLNISQSANIPRGQSGFSSLNVAGNLDATLNLSNISYNVSGQVNQVLTIPEPTSGLFLAGLAAGASVVVRRRRK